MRLLHLAVAVALASGCGGDTTAPTHTGTVAFVLDGQSCLAAQYPINVFIDGVSRGTYTFVPGGAGQSFADVAAGGHSLSARLVSTNFTWGPASVTVIENATFTYTMQC